MDKEFELELSFHWEYVMQDKDSAVANSTISLREEFDDWGLLFDPDADEALGVNEVGIFVWKRLDGKHTREDILKELYENYEDIPEEAGEHIREFIQELTENGLAGYGSQKV